MRSGLTPFLIFMMIVLFFPQLFSFILALGVVLIGISIFRSFSIKREYTERREEPVYRDTVIVDDDDIEKPVANLKVVDATDESESSDGSWRN